jgi:hydroxymethylbilane synthase
VQRALERLGPTEIVVVETSGDRDRATALSTLTTTGFFTKELEQALVDGRVDVAVHSLKDLPTRGPADLELVAVPARGDARDSLLVRPGCLVDDGGPLPVLRGGRIGTGSNRRRAQVRALRPDLEILDLRGNVPTRVRKLADGQYDAILVAEAALGRLDLDLGGLERRALDVETMVPAPGQAALAVQMRLGDARRDGVEAALHHPATFVAVTAERLLMSLLEGGCRLPLGVHVRQREGEILLLASVAPAPRPGELPEPAAPPLELRGPDLEALVAEALEALRPLARRADRSVPDGSAGDREDPS